MKVLDAIEAYLSHQRQKGLEPSSVRTTGHALRTVLAPFLAGEVADLGAEGIGEALVTALEKRVSRATRKPLIECTRELYFNAAKAFLGWAVEKEWLRANPLAAIPARAAAPAAPPIAPKHVGQLIRNLREAAGLTRNQFEELVGLSATTIKGIDLGYHRPTGEQVRKLLAAPCMARLPEMAKAAGLDLGLGDNGVGEE